MTNPLYNKDGVAVPKRPEYSDELITATVKAELEKGRIFRATLAKNPNGDIIDKLAKDFAEVWHDGADAYEIAKELESQGYSVNTQVVDDIECLDGAIFSAHSKATKKWLELHQPVPPFEVGARLMIERYNTFEPEHGTIESIYECRPATYSVIIDGTPEGKNTRRLIDFEDAVLEPTSEDHNK
ncbi:hypothetical protein OTK49_03200 [Vibrio coralliirubri]|uniref:hypothetical protein n=1 Tax=Vibrio coralliirubri TaxID=1516159 RepID=UPI002284F536|nr:hypothetical protein [Vibrio coralliirubri]MCY9861523.1 hypothetical protein [Vibrio coralliirubri]